MRRLLIPAALILSACGSDAPPPEAAAPAAPSQPAYVELKADPAKATMSAAIDANDFAKHIQTISSDEYEGRGPGSLGERLTLNYFENEFRRIGFLPAVADGKPCASFPCDGASYFQRVPMVETKVDPATTLTFTVAGQAQTLVLGKDMVIGSRAEKPQIEAFGPVLSLQFDHRNVRPLGPVRPVRPGHRIEFEPGEDRAPSTLPHGDEGFVAAHQ